MANGVTFIDPGQGSLAESLAKFGTSLVARSKREEIREEELMRDPAKMQSLAAAFRAADKAGQGGTFLQSLGVRESFGEALGSYMPTVEEVTGQTILELGAIPAAVRRQVAGDVLGAETDEAQTTRGLPELTADLALLQTGGDLELMRGLRQQGFFTQEAGRQVAESEAAEEQAKYNRRYFDVMEEIGGARIRANAENIINDLQGQVGQAQIESVKKAVEAINSIDQSTPEGRHMAFMANAFMNQDTSRFANYLAQQEQMGMSLRLAKLRAAPTVEDRIAMTVALTEQMEKALADLRELEEGDADKDQLDSAIARVEGWRLIGTDLQREGTIFEFDVSGARPGMGFFGQRKGVEEFIQTVQPSQDVQDVLEFILDNDPESYQTKEGQRKIAEVRGILGSREQEQFDQGLEALFSAPIEAEREPGTGEAARRNVRTGQAIELTAEEASDRVTKLKNRNNKLRELHVANLREAAESGETGFSRQARNLIERYLAEIDENTELIRVLEFRYGG